MTDRMAAAGELRHTRPATGSALRVFATCLLLWALPMLALLATLGRSCLCRKACSFHKAAVVTFGGAYAVLAYIAQRAVESYGWLEPGEMVDDSVLLKRRRAR